MNPRNRRIKFLVTVLNVLCFLMIATVCFADPIDDAGAKVGGFIQKAGQIALGLVPATGGLAIGALAVWRMISKSTGNEENMGRASGGIGEVLKLVVIGEGAATLVTIMGSILK